MGQPFREAGMVVLKPVIRVRELPPMMARLRQHLPSIRELVSPTPSPHEPDIIRYLAQGETCGLFNDRGLAFDVLDRAHRIDLSDGLNAPAAINTDGTWVWSGVLPYYVARYHLRLPEDFVRFAEARGWRIDRAAIDIGTVDCRAYDSIDEPAVVAQP
jgi:hypothetical protein